MADKPKTESESEEEEQDWRAYLLAQMQPADQARWLLDQLERHKDTFAEHEGLERRQAMEQIEKFGQRVIWLLFGLNAGAIALIITLIGNIQSEDVPWSQLVGLFKWSFYAFSAGLLLAVLTPTLGYFNANYIRQYHYDPVGLFNWLRDQENVEWYENFRKRMNRGINLTQKLAVLAAVGSAICFAAGLWLALSANPPPT